MNLSSSRYLLGALVALSLSGVAASVGADCTYPLVVAVKGSISGTFYDTAGTPTKVKCDAWVERRNDDVSFMSIHWGRVPGNRRVWQRRLSPFH